jgi:hypothetical protein
MNRQAGRLEIEFPSTIKLTKYFPYKENDALRFAELISKLGTPDIDNLGENQRAKLPINIVEQNINKFLAAIENLL